MIPPRDSARKEQMQMLVIDDEADVGEFIVAAAQGLGFDCRATTHADEFLAGLNPDVSLVMMDLMMPEVDGVELLRVLAKRGCRARIILMSGVGKRVLETAEELAQSLGLAVAGHLQKPFRLADLEGLLRKQVVRDVTPAVAQRPPIVATDDDLRRAIDRGEFILHYQPQMDMRSDRVTGVEALVRWQHPVHGLIFPDAFIGRAESLGLIDALGWLVAKRAMTEIKLFTGSDGAPLTLSLNVSVHTLQDLSFPDKFVALAQAHGVSPANVILEITESGLIKELCSALDILTRLRMKQVQLSIDDFGTGFAMMQQLRHVPATEIKIDKSFVHDMHANDSARVMVLKTIELGHELGMKVVAEGVETAAQREFLRANGCDFAQGYFYSRPLAVPVLQKWLAAPRSYLVTA